MKIQNKNFRAVWFENRKVKLIDQTKLPFKFSIYTCKNYTQTVNAIKDMVVRGAPAIGAAGAFAVAQAALAFKGKNLKKFQSHMKKAASEIKRSRPTAVNLMHDVDCVLTAIRKIQNIKVAKMLAVIVAQAISIEYINVCKKIGQFGNKLIKNGDKILTHCNAGALATVDIGTALAPIRAAKNSGKKIFVYVDETRPRLQGAKLTAFELAQEKIPHAIIADNAAGYFMQQGEIDLCIVGADRIAKNGDFANKIGTYEKAVLAKENKIPFYVAAPLSTFDFKCKNGKQIPIEFRSEDEVKYIDKKLIANKKSRAKNPGFDVTPVKYVTAFITEKGIIKPAFLLRKKPGKNKTAAAPL